MVEISSGSSFPGAAQRGLLAFGLNLTFVILLFKELMITTFDPHHGDTVGARPRLIYYLLLAVSALPCVIAFEAVGSILVVAMMIIPPAIASLFTRNLKVLIGLTLAISLVCALLGHILSLGLLGNGVARLIGFQEVGSTNTAGGIAIVAGLIFAACAVGRRLFRKTPREADVPSA